MKDLVEQSRNHNYDAVIKEGDEVRQLYPQYIYDANAYQFIADAYLAKGDKQSAVATLTSYEKMGGHSPAMLKQLASLEEGLGDPKDAAATLDRLNYIDPVGDEDLHRHLGAYGWPSKTIREPSANSTPSWRCTRSTRLRRSSIWLRPTFPPGRGTRPKKACSPRSRPRPTTVRHKNCY